MNKICFFVCSILMIMACAMPMNKVEARGEGAIAAAAAGIGVLFGAAIASDAYHHNCQRARDQAYYAMSMQQQTMNYVLMNYNPALHDRWVRYVVVDCCSILNPVQQEQLLNVMNQRRDEMSCQVQLQRPAN